tara:strand:- start:669 stop:911 length:243 start_codon:yes stop_codon:yes gene_type:complete
VHVYRFNCQPIAWNIEGLLVLDSLVGSHVFSFFASSLPDFLSGHISQIDADFYKILILPIKDNFRESVKFSRVFFKVKRL